MNADKSFLTRGLDEIFPVTESALSFDTSVFTFRILLMGVEIGTATLKKGLAVTLKAGQALLGAYLRAVCPGVTRRLERAHGTVCNSPDGHGPGARGAGGWVDVAVTGECCAAPARTRRRAHGDMDDLTGLTSSEGGCPWGSIGIERRQHRPGG